MGSSDATCCESSKRREKRRAGVVRESFLEEEPHTGALCLKCDSDIVTHVSLLQQEGQHLSGSLKASAENQASTGKPVDRCHGSTGPAMVGQSHVVMVTTATTTDIYWALTMCQTPRAKCFLFIISFKFLASL